MAEPNQGCVSEDMIADDRERMVRCDQVQAALRHWLDALEYGR